MWHSCFCLCSCFNILMHCDCKPIDDIWNKMSIWYLLETRGQCKFISFSGSHRYVLWMFNLLVCYEITIKQAGWFFFGVLHQRNFCWLTSFVLLVPVDLISIWAIGSWVWIAVFSSIQTGSSCQLTLVKMLGNSGWHHVKQLVLVNPMELLWEKTWYVSYTEYVLHFDSFNFAWI